MSTGFVARFNGTCLACAGPIVRGQVIVRQRRRHGRSGYRHMGCGHDWSQRRDPVRVDEAAREVVAGIRAS